MLQQIIHRYFPTTTIPSDGVPHSSTSPLLPLELVFNIIDEGFTKAYQPDVHDILSLSLVCRAFAQYCRPTLFRCICVACCSACLKLRCPVIREGSGWHKPTLYLTPSEFSGFLQQDSSSLGNMANAIEELHLVLPSIFTSNLMRSFGLDNVYKSNWPWLWILHRQKEQLKGIKRLKFLLGSTPLPGFLQAAVMRMADEAPRLEMLDVYGVGVASTGKVLSSPSSSQLTCASVKLLEVDMSVWEYIYNGATSQDAANYQGTPTFPNLRGLALRGATRALFQAPPDDSEAQSRGIVGGDSSPGITHIQFQRLYGRIENEHIFILGLSSRTLRCLHLELAILREAIGTVGVPHQAVPLSSLVSLEYIEVEMMGVGHIHDSLDWVSRSVATMSPSAASTSDVLNKLRVHIIVNDPTQADSRRTTDEQRLEIGQKYSAIWRTTCLRNRWANLEQACVYALVRVLIEGDASGRTRIPRLLGKYCPSSSFEGEEELGQGRASFCSCSDFLQSERF